jgi:hypothetical protein
MKKCTVCEEAKPFAEFHKRKAMKDGHRSACKDCEYERRQGKYRNTVLKNSEKHNRARGHRPLEEYLADRRRNPVPNSYRVAKRRATKKRATPTWAGQQYIKDLYANAKEASAIFEAVGVKPKFQVDHIVPLQHDQVCGLHVEHNLQVLTAEENQRKSNAFKAGY